MLSAISGMNPYSTYGLYGASTLSRAAQSQAPDKTQAAQRSGVVTTARKIHQPDTPVQPVTPARAVSGQEDPAQAGLLRFGSDPAEMAVRMRIQYPGDDAQQANDAQDAGKANPSMPGLKDGETAQDAPVMPGMKEESAQNAPRMPGMEDEDAPEIPGLKDSGEEESVIPALEDSDSKSAQEVMEEEECQTCKERKYQDGSDDPGVSFKTPTHVAPEQAAAAVRGHENEHVVREQAQAQQEGRKVVSQSVTYHTAICPECGDVYVSGGTTRTVTKADNSQPAQEEQQEQQQPQVQQAQKQNQAQNQQNSSPIQNQQNNNQTQNQQGSSQTQNQQNSGPIQNQQNNRVPFAAIA